ncbi:hypothetical protein KNP414_00447 [Paenibacillus mucilaginosus KNP414]|uniref:Uncharacterized protein n=1 Tax=Paenibacillus mucilaginosus (strain KNP414) TaxID=1036673 RepID=F8FPC2_PAEMK|nr:hypothetical protein KNP414_00447 [Paenibacillus mucilaginosus KNP414]
MILHTVIPLSPVIVLHSFSIWVRAYYTTAVCRCWNVPEQSARPTPNLSQKNA